MKRVDKINYYLDIAQTVAARGTCLRRNFGAIIVKNDEIISTGYVSNFVQVDYTTGMAHAMYNGFTILPTTEEYHHLHGEVVSYGILVMLTADKQYAERDRLLAFNRSIGLPTHLADIHARPEDLPAVTEKALAGIDVRVWPYPVAQQMLIDAVMEREQVG